MATSIPPHNAAELLDAAIALIDRGGDADPLEFVTGAGFPDRRPGRRPASGNRRESYRHRPRQRSASVRAGRSSARKAAAGRSSISEIPYGVQKGKLIEGIAALINDKKAADPRRRARRIGCGGSAGAGAAQPHRRSRQILMDGLFRLSDLEIARAAQPQRPRRQDRTPRVMSLREALARVG